MKVIQTTLLIPAILALAACTSIYGPYKGDTGYSDVALQNDTYEVTFVGYDGMNETISKKYALMRAAELTLLHGRQYFEVVDSGSRTRVVTSDVPPTSTVTRSTTGAPQSRSRYYSETYSGGYTVYHDRPEASLHIHLLPGPKDGALNANQIIQDAQTQDKVEFKELAARPATQPR